MPPAKLPQLLPQLPPQLAAAILPRLPHCARNPAAAKRLHRQICALRPRDGEATIRPQRTRNERSAEVRGVWGFLTQQLKIVKILAGIQI